MATISEIAKKYFDELFYAKDRSTKLDEIIKKVNSLKYEDGKSLSYYDKIKIFRDIKLRLKTTVLVIKEADNKRHLDSVNHSQDMLDKLNERLNSQIENLEENKEQNK